MSNLEEQRDTMRPEIISEEDVAPSKQTLKELKIINNRGMEILNFVYSNWDSYDTLTQQSLPQLDYEKAIRLTELSRNTLEKFLDMFSNIKSKDLSNQEVKELMKRANLTMRSLSNYFNKVGIPYTEVPVRKAA